MPAEAHSQLCPPRCTLLGSQSIAVAPSESYSLQKRHSPDPSLFAWGQLPHRVASRCPATRHLPDRRPPSTRSVAPAATYQIPSIHRLFQYPQQILTIGALRYIRCQSSKLVCVDITQPIHDLLGTSYLQPMPLLDRVNERSCLEQRVMRPRIEPRNSSPKHLRSEKPTFQIPPV